MSAAASPALTSSWAKVPYSFIENQALFTAAERAMVLIVLRRENNSPGKPVTVTDELWRKWTGLEARTKEAAIAGLRRKCLVVKGRGENAGYSFARDQWHSFVSQVNPGQYKPRTAGRGVDPKPGAKIHPTCRERGCGLMAAQSGPQLVESPLDVTPNAQPVAQTCAAGADPAGVSGQLTGNRVNPLVSIRNAQRVARSVSDGVEQIWARTLAVLQQLFPLVDAVFLVRLVAVVRALFPDIQDAELAGGVEYAYSLRVKTQKREGLFLLTVPRALQVLRSKGARGRPTREQERLTDGRALLEGVRMVQDRVSDALRARGAPFESHLAELAEVVKSTTSGEQLEAVDERMQQIEARIMETARASLSDSERKLVAEQADAMTKPYRELWGKVQLDQLWNETADRAVLTLLGIPRLSLFYA